MTLDELKKALEAICNELKDGKFTVRKPDFVDVVRCKDCKWFGKLGCAIEIVYDTDRPKENDFCSFGERRDDAEVH